VLAAHTAVLSLDAIPAALACPALKI